jgi:hypothetical protein
LVIAVLLLRLFVGESAHALSMTTMMPVEVQPSSATGCPDHPSKQTQQDSVPSDSCKRGGCDCPCLHASALAVDVEVFARSCGSEPLAVLHIDPTPQGRPNSPFRPPA